MKIKEKFENVKISLKMALRLLICAVFFGAILEASNKDIWFFLLIPVAIVAFEYFVYEKDVLNDILKELEK